MALLAVSTVSELGAGTFTSIGVGDVIIGFRINGKNNLVVDAGSISNFTNAAPNTVIPITAYSPALLSGIGTNSLNWAAFSWFDNTFSQASAQDTLFISKARPSLNLQSGFYQSQTAAAQYNVVAVMQLIPFGAMSYASYNVNNTATAIIEPQDTTGSAYTQGLSYDYGVYDATGLSDFGGTLNGQCENTTPNNFVTAGVAQRSDFYWSPPSDSGGAVKYLGFFQLSTNGSMSYVAYPVAPTVSTVAASAVAASSAQLNCSVATINTNTDVTSFYFQYGLTTSYGSVTTVSNIGIASGNYGVTVSNLTAGSTYYFRAVAFNQYGTNYGSGLTFTTAGGAPTTPVITNFGRTNNISYVSFTTGSSGTYTLRGTNDSGFATARTNWPAITSTSGNGSVKTLQDTTSDSGKYYIITAQ